jgi:hypothetical protein
MKKLKLISLIFITLVLSSCREEIIPPGNKSGNINQPVVEKYLNSFSFTINADNITYNLNEYMNFNERNAQIFISVFDHSSGSVELSLFGKTRQLIFSKKAENDITGESVKTNSDIPESLRIDFENFTGKLKLTVNRF